MSDLISKAALFNALCNAQDKGEIFQIINAAPTVDAEPVRHGHWIVNPLHYGGFRYECSDCGAVHRTDERHHKPYCPDCGAKLDE